MDLVCIIMHCQDTIIISYHKRSKRVNLYTYALARKKTGLHAKFQVYRCFDMDLVCIVMYCQDT